MLLVVSFLVCAVLSSANGFILDCKDRHEDCKGIWKHPSDCTGDNCKYVAEWCAREDEVTFIVKAATSGWVGIGFSHDRSMIGSDVVIGGVTDTKVPFIDDRWAARRRIPMIDDSQDLEKTNVTEANGVTTIRFSRKRDTGDSEEDIALDCQYLLYAYGGKINVRKNGNIVVRQHSFRAPSQQEICLCKPDAFAPVTTSSLPTPPMSTFVTPMSTFVTPMSTFVTPMSTFVTPMSTFVTPKPTNVVMEKGPCPHCKDFEQQCEEDQTCKQYYNDFKMKCEDVFSWTNDKTRPVCSMECKAAFDVFQQFAGEKVHCCSCGKFTDDSKLEDVRYTEQCLRQKSNIIRLCFDGMMPDVQCTECKRERMEDMRPHSCMGVFEMCSKDKSCKKLLDDAEKKCVMVTEASDEDAVCSNECLKAHVKFLAHKIGKFARDCDCGMPSSMKKDPAFKDFEKKCYIKQNRIREFCEYKKTCKGPQVKCDQLFKICMKDDTCKQQYDDRENKCKPVLDWTNAVMVQPMCTDDCKKAHNELFKNKIWKRSVMCDCGSFDDTEDLNNIKRVEKCFRRRLNLHRFCPTLPHVTCPKDHCEPETCSDAKDECIKQLYCKPLYIEWKSKCIDTEPFSECTEECKNASYKLFSDSHGERIQTCNCGDIFGAPQEDIAASVKCFRHKDRIQKTCGIESKYQCTDCKSKKVCPIDCQETIDQCVNDTTCGMIWKDYLAECNNVTNWDSESQLLPNCTDKCRKLAGDLLKNPFGRKFTCCKCTDRQCIQHKMNIKTFCGLELDSIDVCQYDRRMCAGDMSQRSPKMYHTYSREPGSPRKEHGMPEREGQPRREDGPRGKEGDDSKCHNVIDTCKKDKCCSTALYNVRYYCQDVMRWTNSTPEPACADECTKAFDVLTNDPIWAKIRCCDCGEFSDGDKNDLRRIRDVEICKRFKNNFKFFCNKDLDKNCTTKLKDICKIGSCQDLTKKCLGNPSCRVLFEDYQLKCPVLFQVDPVNTTCSHECKLAATKLTAHPDGRKLKCCDCGNPANMHGRPDVKSPNSHLFTSESCYQWRSNMRKYCDVDPNLGCDDCRQRACPFDTSTEAFARCENDTYCNSLANEVIRMDCLNATLWNGTGPMPVCTDECKYLFDKMVKHSINKCYKCEHEDEAGRNRCTLQNKNLRLLCGVEAEPEECKAKHQMCDRVDEKIKALVDNRVDCPTKLCQSEYKKCLNEEGCRKYFNDVLYYCQNVLTWENSSQAVAPVCSPDCRASMEKFSLVSNLTLGGDIMCCSCGKLSDLQKNSLAAIREWEVCQKSNRNIRSFCATPKCPDCDKENKHPTNQLPCSAVNKVCDGISGCKRMKDRLTSSCSEIFAWERGIGRRPQCNSECREAWMAMAGTSYSTTLCCDCQDLTNSVGKRNRCQKAARNMNEICDIDREKMCDRRSCGRNNSAESDDCFNHLEKCNSDMECRNLFFDYTTKCAAIFAGDRLISGMEKANCSQAARKMFSYKDFGRHISECKCKTHPDLCKDLFKNRFLLNRVCMAAEERCKGDPACSMLRDSFNSCTVTETSCPLSCRAKAVLFYRNRVGRAWWNACGPHYFEQVCFELN